MGMARIPLIAVLWAAAAWGASEAVAHFGLGAAEVVDVEVVLPHGKGRLVQRGVKANQRITHWKRLEDVGPEIGGDLVSADVEPT